MAAFDQAYYQRYYYDARTAVTSQREMDARARLIAAYVNHVTLPVRRMLDAGCGIGLLRPTLKRLLPRAEYVGLDPSEYLCRKHGWVQGTIEAYRPSRPFDLVICYDVLQYLDTRDAGAAIANLGRLCRGVLYFSALTRADWNYNCDPERTDRAVHLRSGDWYRLRLRRMFREVGAGFWIRRGIALPTWELECL